MTSFLYTFSIISISSVIASASQPIFISLNSATI
jgi:hypothetical protein